MLAHGHQVTVLDEREIAWGSTAASTALLQYEIDTPLTKLSELYGSELALLAYRACVAAVGAVAKLAQSVRDVDYAATKSLYYASQPRQAGFEVELLRQEELESSYGSLAPRGILSAVAGRLDPYRMTSRLLARQARKGVEIFDRTVVEAVEPEERNVIVRTTTGERIAAKHVIMAAGYACQRWIDEDVAKNRSSYAFITDPLEPETLGRLSETLVWESARPYLYLRTTGDGRLIVGGEDDAVDAPVKRDANVESQVGRLCKKLQSAFPCLAVEPNCSPLNGLH